MTDIDNLDIWDEYEIDQDDDDDEGVNPDTTKPFQPSAASTPYQPQGAASDPYHGGEEHEMSNLGPEQSGMGEKDPLLQPQESRTWSLTKALWPDANPDIIETSMEQYPNPDPNSTKNLRIMVNMKDGRKTKYPLYTRDIVTGKERLNPNLPKQIQRAPGQSAVEQIEEIKKTKEGS